MFVSGEHRLELRHQRLREAMFPRACGPSRLERELRGPQAPEDFSSSTFPTGVAFDDHNRVFVVEAGYSYGEKLTTPRIVEVRNRGETRELLVGNRGAPWNGIAYHDGALFVAEGGELDGGRIVRYQIVDDGLGSPSVLVEHLPSTGDHHTDGPVVSRDGWVYFGQGTATNSGIVGPDNYDYGWLKRNPRFHDTPCDKTWLSDQEVAEIAKYVAALRKAPK